MVEVGVMLRGYVCARLASLLRPLCMPAASPGDPHPALSNKSELD
jgi:hypothetical protein